MNLLKPPASKYTDHYDQERFNFIWKLFLFLASVFAFLSTLHFIYNDPNFYISIGGFIVVTISMLVSYLSKSYIFAAAVGVIGGSIVCQVDLFIIISSQKFVASLWIISITLSAFYLLGSKAGLATMLFNFSGMAYALFYVPKELQLSRIEAREAYDLQAITINLVVIVIFITYLMIQIQKTSKSAEEKSRNAQADLKKQYDIVQAQNEEKTVMLKEIHHRVKNNLQVITSLLRLQSREIKDEKSIGYFDDATQRVLAMALIHEKMYQSDDLAKIDLAAYLKTLSSELIQSYAVDKDIELSINCEIEFIQPKSLVSFALMFNELIANSLKHAFATLDKGVIKIDIIQSQEDEVIVTYHDNGIWRAQQKESSFGLELISDLCEQLDGKCSRTTDNGTTYIFTFDYLNVD